MSAFIRIYTSLGKEHICTAEAYQLKDNSLQPYGDATDINCVKHTVGAGQPCNIHIRYEDQEIESECILEGCTLDPQTQVIQYKTSKINIVRYKGIKDNE